MTNKNVKLKKKLINQLLQAKHNNENVIGILWTNIKYYLNNNVIYSYVKYLQINIKKLKYYKLISIEN